MKKKRKLTAIWIVGIIMVLIIGSSLYKNSSSYISSNNYLSSKEETEKSVDSKQNENDTEYGKSFDFDKFTGKWSLIEFTSDKDTKITINDGTKISKGIFYIVVLDSDYNIIAKKNELKENGDIDFTIPKSGKYIIRIVGKNATGSFNIKVSANNKISLSHKDFFN
ncbi:hypothetical protein [Clostridium sp. JN-9]|uniref:hypothetical protein n=1 Tax=Clostridium sp. JN-9 TaxID=2507159 RepID=UPI000FFE31CF|nr:hypothetical protein [Clostridium sp. JN-9]QAT39206.1 hypothetical protein EQM05_02460 [Clostridium sp. JN-9]